MFVRNGLFSSESVSEGHPDKLADRISDAVLDEFLGHDPLARVACETLLADQCVVVAGEFKTRSPETFRSVRERAVTIVTKVLHDAGYRDSATGIDPERCEIQVRFNGQSADINRGVDRGDGVIGAGDQGLMFGYACDDTPELMPAPIVFAHRLVRRQAELRRNGVLPWLGPDAKSQVTFRYEAGRPVAIEAVVLSTQHDAEIDTEALRAAVSREIIDVVIPARLRAPNYRELINPTGRFVTGGPKGDTGLTGRKIIVDTYGGSSRHGGGAFSGKDPSKVDRSAAYAMRWVAKNAVAAGLADRIEIQVAYAIGTANPVGLYVETFGTGHVPDAEIIRAIREVFDLRPSAIIRDLNLLRPIYAKTATYGHFGRELPEFTWERTDRADALRAAAKR